MIIGIPRSLFFYKYKTLIETFFKELKVDYVISDISNKQILEDGKLLSPSESCINLKLFLGHIKNLENKCNFLFIPRIESIKKNEKTCTNFYLLPDLVRNLFDINVIDFNVNEEKNESFKNAFIETGLYLGFPYNKTLEAYRKGLKKQKEEKDEFLLKQTSKINDNNKKILVLGHIYNTQDEMIGKPITNILERKGFSLIYADVFDEEIESDLSSSIYFSYNKDLLRGLNNYKKYVNGIVLISAFPCGPDSIVNELIIRNVKDIPVINLIVDEANSITGLSTRLESFIDIVNKEASYEK